MKRKIVVAKRKSLVKNLLLIDGISRSGKFLLANIMNGFKDVEPVQYYGLLEHIPFLEKFGLIEKRTAMELLRCEIDTHCYERLIGRNFNFRRSDKSSILHVPNHNRYLERSKIEDDREILNTLNKKKLYSSFIMHELMPNIDIYFETFPAVKVLSLKRSPVELVYSWYKRDLTARLGNDPKIFVIPFGDKRGAWPWYIQGFENEYAALAGADKSILAIKILFSRYQKAYKRLSAADRKKVVLIKYDDILLNPKSVIKKIAGFIEKKIESGNMAAILKKEHLPNDQYLHSRKNKLAEIKAVASDKYFKQLLGLEKKYSRE